MKTYFTLENTEGYGEKELEILNAEFNRLSEGIENPDEIQTIGEKILRDYDTKNAAAILGKIGGRSKSEAKRESSKKNGVNWEKPHFKKCLFFEKNFKHELENNEWKVKFNMEINGKKTTYNPDYFCKELDCFIEVATSKPNISEQGEKWRQAIKNGEKLRVFWWEGNEITGQFKRVAHNVQNKRAFIFRHFDVQNP